MIQNYIKRTLEPIIKRAASEFPAVALTGPRQSGKTTLLQYLFGKSCRYVSLEPPDVRAAALEDPRGFLEMYPGRPRYHVASPAALSSGDGGAAADFFAVGV